MDSKDVLSFWEILKRPRFDYFIFFIAFLLLASNQVFETTPLGASGTLEVSNGSAIPQDTNYTLTDISDQAIRSAIIFNESMNRDYLSIDVVVDAMNKTVCNITLQSPSDNNSVDIYFEFGYYKTHIVVIVGQVPETYTFVPDMIGVKYYGDLYAICRVRIYADDDLVLQNVLLWAEFEVPVSPLVLDYKTTDGYDLFENEYTRWINMDGLEFDIIRLSDGMRGWIDVEYQNYTLYLPSQNYTMTSLWGNEYQSRITFNVTLHENITTHCLLHMKAVRVYFATDSNYPLTRLSISKYDAHRHNIEIYFQASDVPDYVYIPPYSLFDVEIATITPFSRYSSSSEDTTVRVRIRSNSTNDFHVNIILPYVDFIGIVITPQDFIQIALALILFLLIILRLFTYLHSKKPRRSWKDPRLIPIVIFSVLACIPWYSGLTEISSLSEYPMHIASLGAFPLMGCWTESSSIFLIIPQNGLWWAFLSMMLFWIPLHLLNYFTTPPSDVSENFTSAFLLFSPLLLSWIINWYLGELFPFSLQNSLYLVLLVIPIAWLLCLMILLLLGLYNHGPDETQLSFDAKLSTQIADREITPSEQKPEPEHSEIEARKTINLVSVILLGALLIIPTTLTSVFRVSEAGWGIYNLDSQYYVSPINALEKLGVFVFGVEAVSGMWILGLPIFYFIIFAFAVNFGMKSRPVISGLLFVIYACLPFIFLNTLYGIIYHYYLQIDWVVVSLPYYLLSIITILKIRDYLRDEIKLKTVVAWIFIPLVAIIPGVLLLNWLSSIQIAASGYYYTIYSVMPIFTVIVILVIWPLKKGISWIRQSSNFSSNDGELLNDNVTSDI